MPWITVPNHGSMEVGFPSMQFGFGTEVFKYQMFHDPAISDYVCLFLLTGVLHFSGDMDRIRQFMKGKETPIMKVDLNYPNRFIIN